jgi:hypothetical protein
MCPRCYRAAGSVARELDHTADFAAWLIEQRHGCNCTARQIRDAIVAGFNDLDKQDPAEGGTSAGSTDLHSGIGSFGGCSGHSGTS